MLGQLGALASQLIPVPSGDPLSASAGPQAADSLSVVISISSATFHPTKCLTFVRCYCEWLHAGFSTPGPGFFSGTKCPGHKNTAPGMGETNPNKEKNRHRSQHKRSGPQPTDMESPTTQISIHTEKQTQDESKDRPRHRRNRMCITQAYRPQTCNTDADSAHAWCTTTEAPMLIVNTEYPSGSHIKLPWIPHLLPLDCCICCSFGLEHPSSTPPPFIG